MTPRVVEITHEIWQVAGPRLTAADDAAAYLVNADGHCALIDAGCGRAVDKILGNVQSIGVRPEDVELLLLTHCHIDHTGGAAALREQYGCTVVMHELDAPYLERGDDRVTAAVWYGTTITPCTVDRSLTGAREEIRLGTRTITAIHIPGHSPGSVAYVMASDGQKVVFAQDVHGPLDASLKSNAQDYQASLQRLLDLDADVLCEGHFGLFQGRDAITRFIRSFMA